jgi:hypothetical protein
MRDLTDNDMALDPSFLLLLHPAGVVVVVMERLKKKEDRSDPCNLLVVLLPCHLILQERGRWTLDMPYQSDKSSMILLLVLLPPKKLMSQRWVVSWMTNYDARWAIQGVM